MADYSDKHFCLESPLTEGYERPSHERLSPLTSTHSDVALGGTESESLWLSFDFLFDEHACILFLRFRRHDVATMACCLSALLTVSSNQPPYTEEASNTLFNKACASCTVTVWNCRSVSNICSLVLMAGCVTSSL
jgi:hypothetical protein